MQYYGSTFLPVCSFDCRLQEQNSHIVWLWKLTCSFFCSDKMSFTHHKQPLCITHQNFQCGALHEQKSSWSVYLVWLVLSFPSVRSGRLSISLSSHLCISSFWRLALSTLHGHVSALSPLLGLQIVSLALSLITVLSRSVSLSFREVGPDQLLKDLTHTCLHDSSVPQKPRWWSLILLLHAWKYTLIMWLEGIVRHLEKKHVLVFWWGLDVITQVSQAWMLNMKLNQVIWS